MGAWTCCKLLIYIVFVILCYSVHVTDDSDLLISLYGLILMHVIVCCSSLTHSLIFILYLGMESCRDYSDDNQQLLKAMGHCNHCRHHLLPPVKKVCYNLRTPYELIVYKLK